MNRGSRIISLGKVFITDASSELNVGAGLSAKGKSLMTDSLTSYLETHPHEAQSILEQLCRQPSVAAQNLGITEMANLIETLLSDVCFRTQRLLTEGAPPAIYGE